MNGCACIQWIVQYIIATKCNYESRHQLVTIKKESNTMFEHHCETDGCQVRDALLIIGGKWKSMILFTLGTQGILRFNQLKQMVPEISQKMLTQQLRDLERDGLITRKAYPEIPPRVEYAITDLGKSIGKIYEVIHQWTAENFATIEQSRIRYDAQAIAKDE